MGFLSRKASICLISIVSLTACRVEAIAAVPGQLITHDDPAGFTISLPQGWTETFDKDRGRVVVRGTHSEQMILWPGFIRNQQLNQSGAQRLVMLLARQLDPKMQWTPMPASKSLVRVLSQGPSSAVAGLTWFNQPEGTSLWLYGIKAPDSVFRASSDTFSRILQSFGGSRQSASSRHAAPAGAASAMNGGPVTYANWTEPNENAFAIQVPRGWQVVGGVYRFSPLDVRQGVKMIAPDHSIRIFLGDPEIGSFIQPNQALYQSGFREGSIYSPGNGSQMTVRRYMTGQQAALAYVQTKLSRECTQIRVESNQDRPQLAADASRRYNYNPNLPRANVSVGDATFSCQGQSGPLHGHVIAATALTGNVWSIPVLNGNITTAGLQQEADQILKSIADSFRPNPQFTAKNEQIAANAMRQSAISHAQFEAQALAHIRQDQEEMHQMISSTIENRQRVVDENVRRTDNFIRETTDVVDPSTGTQYQVNGFSNYHWMNNQGVIVGNDSGVSPGVDWNQMVTLP